MKPSIRILPILLAAATLTRSEEPPQSVTAPATLSTARILGEIPDGTPPPPAPPKPEYQISEQDILATTTHEQAGRTITIRQIKPIDLPSPPAPAPPSTATLDPEFGQRLAEYREEHPSSGLLFLGATVYRSKDSPPRTLARWWPQGGEEITFWSSADFALIAGGIHSFIDNAGQTHSILMSWSHLDIDSMASHDSLVLPSFAESKATFQIVGDPPAAENLIPIQSLHDLYNREHERLKTAYEGRENARIAREAHLKANPPQPENITLNYWRTEKPAATGKGARK